MNWMNNLTLHIFKKVNLIRQTEAAECGLACLAMIACYHGYLIDIGTIRRKYSISIYGMSLADLQEVSDKLGFQSRGFKLEVNELNRLKLPAILHWDLNHFVVISKIQKRGFTIYDPEEGIKNVSEEYLSKHFTGIAFELEPSVDFKKQNEREEIKFSNILGNVRNFKSNLFHIFLISLVLEILLITSPFITQWTVDEVMVSFDKDLLFLVIAGSVMVGISELLTTIVRTWVVTNFSTRLSIAWETQVISHLLKLHMSYFEKRYVSDILSRLGSTQNIQKIITNDLMQAILDLLTCILTLILLLTYSVKLAIIVIVSTLLFSLIRFIRFKPVKQIQEKIILSEADIEGYAIESVRSMQTVKLFQNERIRLSEWTRRIAVNSNNEIAMIKVDLKFSGLEKILSITESALVMFLGVSLVLSNEFTVGAFLAFTAWKSQFTMRMSSLINKLVQFGFIKLYAERLYDIVGSDTEFVKNERVSSYKLTNVNLDIDGISFRYADNLPFIFNNLTFQVHAGEFLAITGVSGKGKTTLIKVLVGLLAPSDGRILCNGISLNQIGVNYRKKVAAVMQDDQLLTGSILENISLFDYQVDEEWVVKCAEIACIHEEILNTTMGYETVIGDLGSGLSGGQKQRLLLARALYKKPEILFMDEATSHLDLELEKKINTNIKSLKITRVAVAHRPNTLELADRIIKLD